MLEMSDAILLEGVRLNTLIGVYPEERVRRREVIADIEIAADLRPAGISDDLEQAVDYGAITADLRKVAEEGEFFLLEAFAEKCAETILNRRGVRSVTVKISKPGVFADVARAAVRIHRTKNGEAK